MDDDEKPPNCPKCGRFMKQEMWHNENSGEEYEDECTSCGHCIRY